MSKRHFAGRTSNRNTRWTINYDGPSFLPYKFNTVHTYSETVSLTTTGTFTLNHGWRCINIISPDASGGIKVSGFDQMSPLYERWRVNYAHIDLRCWSGDTNAAYQMSLRAAASSATPTDIEIEKQQPLTQMRFLGTQNSGSSQVRFSYGVKPDFLMGRKTIYDDNGVTNGDATTGPTQQARWSLLVENVEALDVVDVTVMVLIKYYVTWYIRELQPISPA